MIKSYRYTHRLTQEEFGKMFSVSAQAISKWERDLCYPDITLLPKLADLFECTIDDFFIKARTDGAKKQVPEQN